MTRYKYASQVDAKTEQASEETMQEHRSEIRNRIVWAFAFLLAAILGAATPRK